MLRALYDRTLSLASHRRAMPALAAISFAESSFFPIPPDILIVPMVLARRDRAWRIAGICTVASVLGGVAGYAIGYFLFETIGRAIIEFYGMMERFDSFREMYNEWGAWIVAAAGLTPFPYKVITITSGVTRLDVFVFMIASALSRGLRFYAEVALLWYFGPPVRDFIEKRLGLVTIAFFVLLIGGFLLLRLI